MCAKFWASIPHDTGTQTDKHFLIKPQAITNAASHQAAQREYNVNDKDNDRARDMVKEEQKEYNDDDTSHSLHSK